MGFKSRQTRKSSSTAKGRSGDSVPTLRLIPVPPLDDVLRQVISVALSTHGSLRAAAKALKIPYSSLRDKAEKYGLTSQWSSDHPRDAKRPVRRSGKRR